MTLLQSLYATFERFLETVLTPLLPILARLVFALVLLIYFWKSALTKLGPGLFGWLFPGDGAYVQIFPRAMEAVSYDSGQLSAWHWAVAVLGMWAEFVLPALIVLGLLTRLAALAMIGFILVQTATDIVAHGATPGAWLDAASDAVILDQRSLWILLLLILVARGGGLLSLDRLALARRTPA
jgi:putative oxidoreductase